MDNIKSLMDKKQYELVIKLTENSCEINDLFYRVSALVACSYLDDALKTIETHRHILIKRLALLIKIHLQVLCLIGNFDKAYEELRYYENLPYESQEVEEILRAAPNMIRNEERRTYQEKTYSEEDLFRFLRSNNQDNVLLALDMLREKEISHYLSEVKSILVNFPKQSIRSFALLLLVGKKINQEFDFKSKNEIIKVNPSLLRPPFQGEEYNSLFKKISMDFNDPSLSENAIQIFSTYALYIYPRNAFENVEALLEAVKTITLEYRSLDANKHNESLPPIVEQYYLDIKDSLKD